MPSVAVLGGSVVGSATALLFARGGWAVSVIDPELPVLAALQGEVVRRPGAPQAAQAHGHTARATYELRMRLPDIYQDLLEGGANLLSFSPPPPLAAHGGRPVDDSLTALRCRRVLIDEVLTRAVRAHPRVTLHPTAAAGLLLDRSATVPRAVGFSLADGTTVRADLLVDAGGRRSPVSRWLREEGILLPEETSDCGLTYYTRHYRLDGEHPTMPGFALVVDRPATQLLGFIGDADYFALALVRHTTDEGRADLGREDGFESAIACFEELQDWRPVLRPASPVMPMGTVRNRMGALADQGRPLVLGLFQVGDSLTTTNPSRGRGIGLGLAAAGRLVDACLAAGSSPPALDDLTLELDEWNARVLRHYFRETCLVDLDLDRRIRAELVGQDAPGTAPDVLLPPDHPVTSQEIASAAMQDPDLFRTFIAALHMMDDDREIVSPATVERVRRLVPRASTRNHSMTASS